MGSCCGPVRLARAVLVQVGDAQGVLDPGEVTSPFVCRGDFRLAELFRGRIVVSASSSHGGEDHVDTGGDLHVGV